jgi:hypothetical protein
MNILPKSLWGDMLPYPVDKQRISQHQHVKQIKLVIVVKLTNCRHNDEAEVETMIE